MATGLKAIAQRIHTDTDNLMNAVSSISEKYDEVLLNHFQRAAGRLDHLESSVAALSEPKEEAQTQTEEETKDEPETEEETKAEPETKPDSENAITQSIQPLSKLSWLLLILITSVITQILLRITC